MTSSMTAFARIQVQEDWGNLVWEIRSVNHRYLEPHFRLPEQMRIIEPGMRESLRKQLNRGKIECTLRFQLSDNQQGMSLNKAVLSHLKSAIDEIGHVFTSTPVNPLEVLQWPGVQSAEETDMAMIQKAALSSFYEALIQLNEMRRREGEELEKFIIARLDAIAEEVKRLRPLIPEILENQKQKIITRLEDARIELNPERLEQEMVMLTQKMDVDEEFDRLNAHLGEVKRSLKSKGAIGRRLDFLMQELNREANTLSSKSIHSGLTQSAVNLKVLIEQMREQVQNIE